MIARLALGAAVPDRWQTVATVAGGILLILVGLHVFRESFELDEEVERLSFASLRLAMLAGVSVSLDELAIGFPLRFSGLPVPLVLATIAVQAFAVTILGIHFGRLLGDRFASNAGKIAGAAFCVVGAWLAISAIRSGAGPAL